MYASVISKNNSYIIILPQYLTSSGPAVLLFCADVSSILITNGFGFVKNDGNMTLEKSKQAKRG